MNTAFKGIGSKKAGGRWNSPGRAVVYVSENRVTAALEILAHVRRAELLVSHPPEPFLFDVRLER